MGLKLTLLFQYSRGECARGTCFLLEGRLGREVVLSKYTCNFECSPPTPITRGWGEGYSHELRGLRNGAAIFSKYSSNTILGIYFY